MKVAYATTVAGLVMIAAGATWALGPFALLAAGVLVAAVGLFVIDDGREP